MVTDLVIGTILLLAGLLTIVFRKRFSRFMHRVLTRFYGAGADVLVDSRTPTALIFAGVAGVGFGVFQLVRAFIA